MTSKTKIIIGVVGVVVVGAVSYYILSTPEINTKDAMVTAPASERSTESSDYDAISTRTNFESAEATTTITPVTATQAQESVTTVPVVSKPTTVPVVQSQTISSPTVIVDPEPTAPAALVGITLAVVATHNSANSCWSVIAGNVYDLTAYVPKHPGGKSEILAMCGKDGSSLFTGQHGGQSKPEQILAGYYLNVLTR